MNSTVALAVRHCLLAALGVSIGAAALAQDASTSVEGDTLEEVVVTGTSLKGVAPVGSNLVTIDREAIEDIGAQTVQQILKTVPSMVGLQSAGQGAYGSFDGAGTNAPTIHGLGASASNSTLVLLNGHRLPVSGINHVLADPNIVAPLALERVEVLADGASSVYGSDAVAGVVNFITRRNVDGFEASVQKGFADGYGTFNAGFLRRHDWDTGSLVFSYNFSDRDTLEAVDRDYVRADQRPRGGRNFTPNRCGPASITVGAQHLLLTLCRRGHRGRGLRSLVPRGPYRQRTAPQSLPDRPAERWATSCPPATSSIRTATTGRTCRAAMPAPRCSGPALRMPRRSIRSSGYPPASLRVPVPSA